MISQEEIQRQQDALGLRFAIFDGKQVIRNLVDALDKIKDKDSVHFNRLRKLKQKQLDQLIIEVADLEAKQ